VPRLERVGDAEANTLVPERLDSLVLVHGDQLTLQGADLEHLEVAIVADGRGSAKTRVVAGLRVEGGTVRVGTGSTEPTCWIAGAAADQASEAGEDQADKQSVHR